MAPNPVAAWFNKNYPREYAQSTEGNIEGRAAWFMLARITELETTLERERAERLHVDETRRKLMREYEDYKKWAGVEEPAGEPTCCAERAWTEDHAHDCPERAG